MSNVRAIASALRFSEVCYVNSMPGYDLVVLKYF